MAAEKTIRHNMAQNFVFPSDFLWGASTSAFQIEGGYDQGGRGPATTDRERPHIASARTASDHYHHWQEDIGLMAEMGLKAYRMSFSWSRIMPAADMKINEQGLAFYDGIVNALLAAGIEPIVTLYHFECPQALVDAFGGWKSRRMIDAYVRYAAACFRHFSGRIRYWVTINEQLIAAAAPDLTGDSETDPVRRLKNMYQMSWHMSLAEHQAVSLLRKIDPAAKIGPVCAMQVVYPWSSQPQDVMAAQNGEEMMEFRLLDLSVRGDCSPYVSNWLHQHAFMPETREEDQEILHSSVPDFIGVNYYFSVCAKAGDGHLHFNMPPFWVSDSYEIAANPHLPKTEWMNMGIDPDGLYVGMRKICDRYHLPVIVTENGFASSDRPDPDGHIHDQERIDYLRAHVSRIGTLLAQGYPVFGYCPWSFIDALSSHQGFSKRYGFVYVRRNEEDMLDCARIRKDSFAWYQNLIRTGSLS